MHGIVSDASGNSRISITSQSKILKINIEMRCKLNHTLLFQNAMNGSQMVIQFVVVCSCDLLVLSIICFSGEKMSNAHDISFDIYSLYWYQFDDKSKYIVWFMIARTQKTYYFASYKGLNCSLEMFISVRIGLLNFWISFFLLYHTIYFKVDAYSSQFQIIRKAAAALAMLKSI